MAQTRGLRYIDGRHIDGRYFDGRYIDGRHIDGRHTGWGSILLNNPSQKKQAPWVGPDFIVLIATWREAAGVLS